MKIGDVKKRLSQTPDGSLLYIGKIRGDQVIHVLTRYKGHRMPESVGYHIELNNFVKGYILRNKTTKVDGKVIELDEQEIVNAGETKCVCAETLEEDCVESIYSGQKDVKKVLKKHFGGLGQEVLRSAGFG